MQPTPNPTARHDPGTPAGRLTVRMIPARIEQALRELPLGEQAIARAAARLADDFLVRQGKVTRSDSSFFDFRGKVAAVVEHFAAAGLPLDDYLQAAVRCP